MKKKIEKIEIFSPALSKTQKDKRKKHLENQQQEYEFDHKFLPDLGLGLLKIEDGKIPQQENFFPIYWAKRIAQGADLVATMLATKERSRFDPLDELEDYEDFFNVLRKPDVIKNYQTNYQKDSVFAEQRLSGTNPLVIKSLKKMPAHINVSLNDLEKKTKPLFSLETISLQGEIEQGHIFIADYTESLSFVQGESYEKGHKYLPKPIAFFWWRKNGYSDRGELVPIAIALELNKSTSDKENKDKPNRNILDKEWQFFTPLDKHLDWFIAKLCVQIADGNHHEMSSHLGRTHLVMETFAVSTARQLAENHPLGLLLRQHFRFMLANNSLARKLLINEGGFVDRILAGTLLESLQIVKNACTSWSIKAFAFPTEIKNRGMDQKDQQAQDQQASEYKLPHYPYRDDGLLLWDAIKKFVTDYLNVFYPKQENIKNDEELQNWAKELAAENGGKIKDMPSSIKTIAELIEIITTIIFTCGPQHSAVNFPQYEYMAFVPNMPLAAYQEITQKEQFPDEKSLMEFLPPQKQTADQVGMMYILSDYRYDRLGYYDQEFENRCKEIGIEAILAKFKQDLNQVEIEIDSNNKSRIIPYPFLKPSLVLNSISI
ncbi:MAG: lipoxygenase family protein [Waterburya sp.]